MKKYVKTIIAAAVMAMAIGAGSTGKDVSAKVYSADNGTRVTFTGVVKKHIARAGMGQKYTAYDLVLSSPKKIKSEDWGGTSTEKKVMINGNYLPKSSKESRFVGKKVKVTGELMPGLTGWYCERYAIMATKITKVSGTTKKKAAKKKAKLVAPGSVKLVENSYYKYWEKNRAKLEADGLTYGDGYDVTVSWGKVSGAAGYELAFVWDEEGSLSKTKVRVQKSGSKYTFTTKGGRYRSHYIAKSVKSAIYNGCTRKFKSSKLSVFVTGSGSCVSLKKVKIRAYKKVNGKKVYGKYKTVKP